MMINEFHTPLPLKNIERNLGHGVVSRDIFPVHAIRKDFPILSEKVNGKNLVWLDNAATTQKPLSVIRRISEFYLHENSNIHRGAHTLAARATDAYEEARQKVCDFLHASSPKEIIFVRGTTEAINLVAHTYARQVLKQEDEILISCFEHHANIVPWQMLSEAVGARLKVIPIDESGQIKLEEYRKLLSAKTKIVCIAQVSNVLGTIAPIAEMIQMAHLHGARVLVDGAQAVSHLAVDVTALDCDFYAFSGHKVYGPTGIGALYVKEALLKEMPPYQGGGNMIQDVTFEKTEYKDPPDRFEAGTGNIADAVGLGAALDYVNQIGRNRILRYEHFLLEHSMEALHKIQGLAILGTAEDKTSVIAFVMQGISNDDIGKALNKEGIAVRTGHHCAQPALRRFGLETAVRPSLAFYNTKEEIDQMVCILMKLRKGQHNFYLQNPDFMVY